MLSINVHTENQMEKKNRSEILVLFCIWHKNRHKVSLEMLHYLCPWPPARSDIDKVCMPGKSVKVPATPW